MLQVLGTGKVRWKGELPSMSDSDKTTRAPRLALEKTGWLNQFASSLIVLTRGPVAPKTFLGDPYFRDCWVEQSFPKLAFAAAVALQVLLVLFPPPVWKVRSSRLEAPPVQMELTWYGPVKNFRVLMPVAKAPKSRSRHNASKAPTSRGADAFHRRQIIISEPLHPTHPRQTLIRPASSQEPPKILPALPNIVSLARSQPVRPKLQLTVEQLAAMRPKTPAPLASSDVAAPDVAAPEKEAGAINIASSTQAPPKPVLPVSPMSAPHAAPQKSVTNAAAPDIAGRRVESGALIALSATPAPVAPPPAIPAGNLSARISISPDGSQPGAPGEAKGGGGGRGPEGIFISGGNGANTSPISGLGIGSASRGVGNPLPSRPRAGIASEDSKTSSADSAAHANSKLDVPPEKVLGSKQVYTLHVNMPNMTSVSGSWVVNFAELDEMEPGAYSKRATSDLAWPVPLRKVDPKYPPELRKENVEGEVVLYAVIRKDGSVDSIQLVRSVDPNLDANAMDALAQWKFRPAQRRGEPVDLEAVVHIPFRSRAPQF